MKLYVINADSDIYQNTDIDNNSDYEEEKRKNGIKCFNTNLQNLI